MLICLLVIISKGILKVNFEISRYSRVACWIKEVIKIEEVLKSCNISEISWNS